MKAKELIKMLQEVDPESEIVTPGFGESYAASGFSLDKCVIHFNVHEASCHFAPHDVDTGRAIESEEDINGYLLDGRWDVAI